MTLREFKYNGRCFYDYFINGTTVSFALTGYKYKGIGNATYRQDIFKTTPQFCRELLYINFIRDIVGEYVNLLDVNFEHKNKETKTYIENILKEDIPFVFPARKTQKKIESYPLGITNIITMLPQTNVYNSILLTTFLTNYVIPEELKLYERSRRIYHYYIKPIRVTPSIIEIETTLLPLYAIVHPVTFSLVITTLLYSLPVSHNIINKLIYRGLDSQLIRAIFTLEKNDKILEIISRNIIEYFMEMRDDEEDECILDRKPWQLCHPVIDLLNETPKFFKAELTEYELSKYRKYDGIYKFLEGTENVITKKLPINTYNITDLLGVNFISNNILFYIRVIENNSSSPD